VVLHREWRAELVVQGFAESYQNMLDRLERFESVEAIRRGIAAAAEGRLKPARKALADLQAKLGISELILLNRAYRRRKYVRSFVMIRGEPEAAERWFRGWVYHGSRWASRKRTFRESA